MVIRVGVSHGVLNRKLLKMDQLFGYKMRHPLWGMQGNDDMKSDRAKQLLEWYSKCPENKFTLMQEANGYVITKIDANGDGYEQCKDFLPGVVNNFIPKALFGNVVQYEEVMKFIYHKPTRKYLKHVTDLATVSVGSFMVYRQGITLSILVEIVVTDDRDEIEFETY